MSTSYIFILLALWCAILMYLTVIMLIAIRSPSDTPRLHATKRPFLTRMLITFWLFFAASAVLLLTFGGPFQFYGIGVFLMLVIVVRIWRWRILRRYSKS